MEFVAGNSTSAGPEGPASGRISIPPWIQLVGLPLLVLLGWKLATHARHAVFIFAIATLIAILLNPIVRNLNKNGIPRPLAVIVVFGIFAIFVAAITIALVNLTVNEAQHINQQIPSYKREAIKSIDATQRFIDRHHLHINLSDSGRQFVEQLKDRSSDLSQKTLAYGSGFIGKLASTLLNILLTIVVTVYMLLDAPRIGRFIVGLFPANSRADELLMRIEQSLINYVRGQTLSSAVMGISAGAGIWLMDVVGIWNGAATFAIPFGVMLAVLIVAPTIGAMLSSWIPIGIALFYSPLTALVVAIFYLLLHQIEGHIVIPKLMGNAVGVHPLIVIFAILAGIQIMGIGGVILVLPLLAVSRQIILFLHEQFELQQWTASNMAFAAAVDSATAPVSAMQGAALAGATTSGHPGPASTRGAERSRRSQLARRAEVHVRRWLRNRRGKNGGNGS